MHHTLPAKRKYVARSRWAPKGKKRLSTREGHQQGGASRGGQSADAHHRRRRPRSRGFHQRYGLPQQVRVKVAAPCRMDHWLVIFRTENDVVMQTEMS